MSCPFYESKRARQALERKSIAQFITPSHSSGTFGLGSIHDNWTLKDAILSGSEANLWVGVCVGTLGDHASELPLRVFEKSGSKRTIIEDHPREAVLEMPHAGMLRPEYMALMMHQYQLAGNGISHFQVSGSIEELWIKNPDLTRPRTNEGDPWVSYYEQEDKAGEKLENLDSSEVVHARQSNPKLLAWGAARMRAGSSTIDMDTEHTAWNANLANNSMVPSGIMTGKAITGKQAKKDIQASLDRFVGSGSTGRPLVLEGDLTWQPTSFTPKEVDWLETQRLNVAKIGALFGFHPARFLSTSSGLSDPLKEVYKAEWLNGVLPAVNQICAAHSLILLTPEELKKGIRILPDLSEVMALREQIHDDVKSFDMLVRNGISVGQAATMVNLPIPDDMPTADLVFRSTSLEPITDGDPLDDAAPPVEDLEEGAI